MLVGAHVQAHYGPKLAKAVALLDSVEEAMPFVAKVMDTYLNYGVSKHRIGDMIYRRGFKIISDIANETLPNKGGVLSEILGNIYSALLNYEDALNLALSINDPEHIAYTMYTYYRLRALICHECDDYSNIISLLMGGTCLN